MDRFVNRLNGQIIRPLQEDESMGSHNNSERSNNSENGEGPGRPARARRNNEERPRRNFEEIKAIDGGRPRRNRSQG